MIQRDKNGRFAPLTRVDRIKRYLKNLPWDQFHQRNGLIRINGKICPLIQRTGRFVGYTSHAAWDLKLTYANVVDLVWEAADYSVPSSPEAQDLRQWMLNQIPHANGGNKRV